MKAGATALLGLAASVLVAHPAAAQERELPRDWNHEHVGPSKHWKELDQDAMKKWMLDQDKDLIVSFYGDGCSHCQELKGQQDKAAKKIKDSSDDILFGRYDLHRFGGVATMLGFLERNYPGWKEATDVEKMRTGFSQDNLTIPQMYHFKKMGKDRSLLAKDESGRVAVYNMIQQVPHGEIGWGPQGGKNLKNWIKNSTSYTKTKRKGKPIKKKAKKAKGVGEMEAPSVDLEKLAKELNEEAEGSSSEEEVIPGGGDKDKKEL